MHLHLCAMLTAVALILPAAASAQESWMQVEPAAPAVSEPTALTLHRGEYFGDNLVPFFGHRAAALQLYSKFAVRDLHSHLPGDTPVDQLTLTFFNPGTHMLVYDSRPELVEASPVSSEAPEDMSGKTSDHPGEEFRTGPGPQRERHHLKALLRVGGKSDGTYGLLTGQRLEIVPSTDPLAKAPGDTLAFTLFFDSRPLGQTVITAWNKSDGQNTVIRTRTAIDGKVGLVLPFPGRWMISAMHRIPGADPAKAQWDSFRGSLTFELASAKAAVP